MVKPAIVIVHGAYFVPSTWSPFIDLLTAAGFEVRCPRLPTCGDTRPPSKTVDDDVAVVQSAIRELKGAGHPIIVLAHSFGGVVATQSITSDLYATNLQDASSAGVHRIIYLAAHLPQPGNGAGDIYAKYGFLSKVELNINDDGTAFPKNAAESFYNDMDGATAQTLVEKNVTHNFALVMDSKVSLAPWKDVRSVYVYCEQDLAIMKELQEAMIADVQAASEKDGSNVIETRTLDAAHCPMLSRPQETLAIVKDVWAGVKA